MIGWIVDKLRELVIDPQTTTDATVDLGARFGVDVSGPPRIIPLTVTVDPEDIGDVDTQAISVLSATTRPTSYEIGGSVELLHEIGVAIAVAHADLEAARQIRDAIATAIVLRLIDSEHAIRQSSDPATGQYVSRITWSIDYRPLYPDSPTEWARLTISVAATLDR